MRSRLVDLKYAAGILALCLLAEGCQPSAPMPPDSSAQAIAAAQSLQGDAAGRPYFNPKWRDDIDDDPPGLAHRVLSITGSILVSPFVFVGSATAAEIKWLSGDRPDKAYTLLLDKASPDNRRIGMNKLEKFGFASNPAFQAKCRLLATTDADETVRASAIRGENLARDRKAASIFIESLQSPNEWVRLEACKALANVPDVKAVEPLVQLLNNPEQSRDVRIAAADALKHYRSLTAARALSGALADRQFDVAWQALRSLRYLTSKNFGYDEGQWLSYFTGPEMPFG
ncbi:MAG TPA: HEAT repeat domain-containing protein [Tepidisphaeraceae bacterium]|nr:HEAT repeat domain-containing protein [Tepidisphaeraceae bacterium]